MTRPAAVSAQFSCPPSVAAIIATQNEDGGWGYRGGGVSWVEPTVFALMAQTAAGAAADGTKRGFRWLMGSQRPDGGFSPRPGVETSTWVTALALLLMTTVEIRPSHLRAVEWLLRQSGSESSWIHRLRLMFLGMKSEADLTLRGWPWYPEAAAWVTPTALTVLALRKFFARQRRQDVSDRVSEGRRFLLSRMCSDGGWNHGSTRALGYESDSYPETTGLALLALSGTPVEKLGKSLDRAESHLHDCRSAEGVSWLRLGLLAHSRSGAAREPKPVACRTVLDASLCLLADAAAEQRNVFLE